MPDRPKATRDACLLQHRSDILAGSDGDEKRQLDGTRLRNSFAVFRDTQWKRDAAVGVALLHARNNAPGRCGHEAAHGVLDEAERDQALL